MQEAGGRAANREGLRLLTADDRAGNVGSGAGGADGLGGAPFSFLGTSRDVHKT